MKNSKEGPTVTRKTPRTKNTLKQEVVDVAGSGVRYDTAKINETARRSPIYIDGVLKVPKKDTNE